MSAVTLNFDILDDLVRSTRKLDGAVVKAGVQGDADSELLTYAAANEFGTDDGHVPERSYIRSTATAKQDDWSELAARAMADAIADPHGDPRRALELLGAVMQGDIQQAIVDIRTPPNAPETIRRKKSDNPLIDTGRLRSAITWVVETE